MDENRNPGVYYQPPDINPVNQQPKKRNTGVVILIVVLVVLLCISIIGSIVMGCYLYYSKSNIDAYDSNESSLVTGGGEFPAATVNEIDINWVNGDIDISTYDGDKILVTEEDVAKKFQMKCYVDENTLCIDEYRNDHHIGFSPPSKDLKVQIPQSLALSELDLEIVSANVTATGINCNELQFNTVSGEGSFAFASQPASIDIESVSGNIDTVFPSDITGWSVSGDSVSGNVKGELGPLYGDGKTKISFNSVSGNLYLNKAE